MNRTPPARRHGRGAPRRATAAVLAALAAAALLLTAPAAGAHGGDGRLEVVDVQPDPAGGRIDVTVRLTYAGDGHAPEEATVTVAGTAPDGSPVTPVALARSGGEGEFAGSVPAAAAGTWQLRVTAVDPPATLELPPQEVVAPAGGAPADAGDGAAEGSDGTVGITAVSDAQAPGDRPAEDGAADDGGAGAIVPSLLIGVALGLVVVFGFNRWRQRRTDGGAR